MLNKRIAPWKPLAFALALSTLPHAFGAQAAQSSPVPHPPGRLVVSGSSVLIPLVTDIARRFEKAHPGVMVEVQASDSAKAIVEVRRGTADIGMLARGVRENEGDLFSFAIARDGVAVIAHRDNPVRKIDSSQLSDILRARAVNWKSLGGRDAPIDLAWRTKGQGAAELVLAQLKLKRDQIGPHTSIATASEALKFVSNDPNGIALASVGDAERSVKQGMPIRLLAYNGVPASTRTLQNRTYALSRLLTLVTLHLPEGLQKQFVDYALSGDVVDLQVKHTFVPYQE
jgi:phosphate transport system substrate-binding protein